MAATSWLEKTVGEIAGSIERAVFTEEHARRRGWLQGLDPRAKLGMFLAVVLAVGLSNSLAVLAVVYALVLAAAAASRTPFDFFVKRVWLGIPLFAGVVIVPSLFLGPAPYLLREQVGPVTVAVSVPATWGALVFVARVGISVSLAVLLVLTTPWADLLKSLQALRVPPVFVLVLSMTYRYIFLFLHTLNGMLESRRSRVVGRTGGGEQRAWIVSGMGYLMNRSFQMSSDVYSAMLARGFGGHVRSYTTFRMAARDWTALGGAVALAVAVVGVTHVVVTA
ncbi:MAG TPA: cobalt ECF transporter T component CbiQ [Candidatus Dormibacteraeota bacterium]